MSENKTVCFRILEFTWSPNLVILATKISNNPQTLLINKYILYTCL